VHLVAFITKKFVTTQGHLNVKLQKTVCKKSSKILRYAF